MKIFQKIKEFDGAIMKNALEFCLTVQDYNSNIRCKKCHSLLPFFRLVLKMKSAKNKQLVKFKCKKCKHINLIKKGKINV